MADAEAPERPEGVPPDAVWVEEDQEWEQGGVSASGEKDGPYRYWRADGTLCNECILREGVPHGPFKRFHESGEVSQEGDFVDGEMHGTRTWHATDTETTEQMRQGGLSEAVWRTEMDYDHGSVTGIRHYDRDGNRILPDGTPYPTRPAGVDPAAEFDPRQDAWVHGVALGDGSKTGLWRYWYTDGALKEEVEYDEGELHGFFKKYDESGVLRFEGNHDQGQRSGTWRRYDEDGSLSSEATFSDDSLTGPYTDRDPDIAHWYSIPGAAALQGPYQDGVAVGEWALLDANDEVLATFDYGIGPVDEDQMRATDVLRNAPRTAREWDAMAGELVAAHHVAEGIIAAARAAANTRKVGPLLALLADHTPPTTRDHAQGMAAEGLQEAGESTVALANLLVRGASPAPVLRALSIEADKMNRGHAALDLINAALLLAPERQDFLFTRGLVLMRLGLDDHAARDAEDLCSVEPDSGEFLREYNRVLFPTFDFWPGHQPPETYYDGLPDAPVQTLPNIRLFIQKFATRLMMLRKQMLTMVSAQMRWLPPELPHMLPHGPVDLEIDSFELEDEDGDVIEIEIDETLDVERFELPDLLRIARADWNAMTWLCWSAGTNDVVLPTKLAPPQAFGTAAGMAVQRLWRCRDKVHMRGYGAEQSGTPGFSWEGLDIDEMPGPLAGIAEQQYAEMAALFRWLADGEQRSPWQDNLRGS